MTASPQPASTSRKSRKAPRQPSIYPISVYRNACIVFDDGQHCLLSARNSRGPIEVLLGPETRDLIDLLVDDTAEEILVEGYFRRRSTGYLSDGSRHYIWTFIPTDPEEPAQDTTSSAPDAEALAA